MSQDQFQFKHPKDPLEQIKSEDQEWIKNNPASKFSFGCSAKNHIRPLPKNNFDTEVSPLAFDYDQQRKEFNFVKEQTSTERLAMASKITEGFEFISRNELLGKDIDHIHKLVNDKFKSTLTRGPALYDHKAEEVTGLYSQLTGKNYATGEDNKERIWWDEIKGPDSKHCLKMYHIEEIKSPEFKTDLQELDKTELATLKGLLERLLNNGFKA